MRKSMLLCVIVLFLCSGVSGLFAGTTDAPTAKPAVKSESVTKSGVVEIKKAEKGEKFDTVLLKVGTETFKLIPGKDKAVFKQVEGLVGKTIEVTGDHMPPNPPKYPLAAIKVQSFKEAAAAAEPATPAPAPAN